VSDYGGINVLRLPPDRVWKPDIVLFNKSVFPFALFCFSFPFRFSLVLWKKSQGWCIGTSATAAPLCSLPFVSILGLFFLSKQREKQRERDLIQTLTKSFILSFSFLLFILYSADGNYEVRYKCNVLIYASGEVLWVPPAIYQVRNIDSFELYYSKYDISYAVFDIDNSFLFIYTTWHLMP